MGKLSAATLALLQDQYRHEASNHLRYESRSSWARFRGLEATADFFHREAKGEAHHARKVQKWIEDRNEELIPEPFEYTDSSQFADFASLFVTAMQVELTTTEKLQAIYKAALNEGDIQLCTQVSELIIEQIEEENTYQTIIDRIVARGTDPGAIHDIDVWIGERFGK